MTREEAVKIIKKEQEYCDFDSQGYEAFSMAIKALEQEPILNKIRAEIEKYRDGMRWNNESLVKWEAINYVLEHIIDKYKAESEVDNGNDD